MHVYTKGLFVKLAIARNNHTASSNLLDGGALFGIIRRSGIEECRCTVPFVSDFPVALLQPPFGDLLHALRSVDVSICNVGINGQGGDDDPVVIIRLASSERLQFLPKICLL